jgi:PleD family two-component response regulator
LVAIGSWLTLTIVAAQFFTRRTSLPPGRAHQPSVAGEFTRQAWGEANTHAAVMRNPRSARHERILLVDDDPGLLLLLRTTFAGDDCAIEEAGSAAEAAEPARSWRPSVIVLDVGLPDRSGLDLAMELMQMRPLVRLESCC